VNVYYIYFPGLRAAASARNRLEPRLGNLEPARAGLYYNNNRPPIASAGASYDTYSCFFFCYFIYLRWVHVNCRARAHPLRRSPWHLLVHLTTRPNSDLHPGALHHQSKSTRSYQQPCNPHAPKPLNILLHHMRAAPHSARCDACPHACTIVGVSDYATVDQLYVH
jgi:hypothetical protein